MSESNELQYKKRAPRRTKQVLVGLTPSQVAGLAILSERKALSRSDLIRRAVETLLTNESAWPKEAIE